MHIGIILDGNRRYAKKSGKMPWEGHKIGVKQVKKLIFEWAEELNIKELTLYAFSMQNFKRNEKELSHLMKLFKNFVDGFIDSQVLSKKDIKFNFIGQINLFSPEIHQKMLRIMQQTKDKKGLIINLAMAYGGREEIVDATKKIARKVKNNTLTVEEIDENIFNNSLSLNHDPDLIIRTGGERRSSNFLAWQSVYSEWFYLAKYWPEFEKEDLIKCVKLFKTRTRNFGV